MGIKIKKFANCKNRDIFYYIRDDQVFGKIPSCGIGFFADEPSYVSKEARKSFNTKYNTQIEVCFQGQRLEQSKYQRYFVPGNKNSHTIEKKTCFEKYINFFLNRGEAFKYWNFIICNLNKKLKSYDFTDLMGIKING